MSRQKDYPKTIRVKDTDYKVSFKRGLESQGYMGLCFYELKEIHVSTGLPEPERLSTLIHEKMHAIAHEYGFELGHDVINKLEGPLARFILEHFEWKK
jgi:hypothetical protein